MSRALALLLGASINYPLPVLAGIDTSNANAFNGKIKFTGTASCEGVREAVQKHLIEALKVQKDAIEVLAPRQSDATGDDNSDVWLLCESNGTITDTFLTTYKFTVDKAEYSAEDAEKVAEAAKPTTLEGIEDMSDVESNVEVLSFERVSGFLEYMLPSTSGCEEVKEQMEDAIAQSLEISPIFVDAECPKDGSHTMPFTVSVPSPIFSEDDAAFRAQHVYEAMSESLSTFLKDTEGLGDQVELVSVRMTDFDAGNNVEVEQPEMTVFIKGTVSFVASNVSCVEVRTSTIGALMAVFKLEERMVKVEDICADHSVTAGVSSNSKWSMKWEFMHQTTLDSAAVKTSVQEKFESDYAEELLAKLRESHAHAMELDALHETIDEVIPASEDEAPEDLEADEEYSRMELSSAATGKLHFKVAAKCSELVAQCQAAIAKVLKITLEAVHVQSGNNCDDGAAQDISEKFMRYWVLVPASVYGSDDASKVKQTLFEGIPPVLSAGFAVAEFAMDAGKFEVDVVTEHQEIELISASVEVETPGACPEEADELNGKIAAATTDALAKTLFMDAMYFTAKVGACQAEDAQLRSRRLSKAVSVSKVQFNMTIPANTQNMLEEIYRADLIRTILQGPGFEASLASALKKENVHSEVSFVLNSLDIVGFTNPEVDDMGVVKSTTPIPTTITTTEPPYSKPTDHTAKPHDDSALTAAPNEDEEHMAPGGNDPFPNHGNDVVTTTEAQEEEYGTSLAPGGNDPFPHDHIKDDDDQEDPDDQVEPDPLADVTAPPEAEAETMAPNGQDPFPHKGETLPTSDAPTFPPSTERITTTTEAAESEAPNGNPTDVTVVAGTLNLVVADAAAFAADPKVRTALQEALATTLAGVEGSWITILSVGVADRRLGRALSGSSVKVEFEIVVPAGRTAPLASAVADAKYDEAISAALVENSVPFAVTGVVVADVSVDRREASGNPDEVTQAPGGKDPFPHEKVSTTPDPEDEILDDATHQLDDAAEKAAEGDADDEDGNRMWRTVGVVVVAGGLVAGVGYFFLSSGGGPGSGSQVSGGYEMSQRV